RRAVPRPAASREFPSRLTSRRGSPYLRPRMSDGRAGGMASGGFALLGQIVRAALGVGALCALVDLWQVTLLDPASIAPKAVAVLVGAYVLGSVVLAVLPLVLIWVLRG